MEGISMTLIVALVMVLHGREGGLVSNLPELTAFAVAGQRMLPISQQCYTTVSTMLAYQPVFSEALMILDQPVSRAERFEGSDPLPFTSALECSGLSFRYSDDEPWVLDGIDLQIPKGSTVGLVGETGSGKSTLLDLMMGLLRPTAGTLTVDGVQLDSEVIGSWRRSIAHVPQDVFLVDSSIAENIAFGVPKDQIDHQRVRESARLAQIDDFIMAAPDGYRTLVGERGVRLSGGQRQRVAVARALVNNPALLLADEPTGNLDPGTSIDIMQLLARINAGGTTIVMATHEAGFVDQMKRRVIELRGGQMMRDERHGGYGDTSGLPRLQPEQVRGAAAAAALTAVLELQREVGIEPTVTDAEIAVAAAVDVVDDPATAPFASALAEVRAAPVDPETPAPAVAEAPSGDAAAPAQADDSAAAPRAASVPPEWQVPAAQSPQQPAAQPPAAQPAPRAATQPVPVIDIPEVDVEELGLAERLGLDAEHRDDEVGPTS